MCTRQESFAQLREAFMTVSLKLLEDDSCEIPDIIRGDGAVDVVYSADGVQLADQRAAAYKGPEGLTLLWCECRGKVGELFVHVCGFVG